MKYWTIREEWFHTPQKNKIIGYYSARYSPSKMEKLLTNIAHLRFYSLDEQKSFSRYSKPSHAPYKATKGKNGRIISIGHEPMLVAEYGDV